MYVEYMSVRVFLFIYKKEKQKEEIPTNTNQSWRVQLAARGTFTVERPKVVPAGTIDTWAAFTFIYICNPETKDIIRTTECFWGMLHNNLYPLNAVVDCEGQYYLRYLPLHSSQQDIQKIQGQTGSLYFWSAHNL